MEKTGKPPIGGKHSLKRLNSENIPSPASTAIAQRGLHKDHPILGLIKNPLIRSSIKLNLSKDESYHSQDQVLEALCNFSPTLFETTFGTRSPLSPTSQNVCPKSDRTRTPIKAAVAPVGNFLTPTRFHSRSDKSSWPIARRVHQKSRCQLGERDSSQTGQITPSTPSPLIDEMRNNRATRRSVDEVVNQPITSPVVATTSDFADDFEVDFGTDPEDLLDSDPDSVDERDHPTKQVQSSFVTVNPPVSRAIRVFVPSDLDLGFAKPKPKTALVCGESSAPSIVAKSGDCGETSAASEPISSSDASTLDVPDPSQVLRATRSRHPPNTSLPKAATTDKASKASGTPICHTALATLNNEKTDTSDRQSKKNADNRKACTMPTVPTCPQKRDVSKHTKQNSKSSDVCGEEPSFKVPSQPKKRKHNSSSKSSIDATSLSLPIGEVRENKTRYLVNWLPRLKGSKLVVIGDMLDFNTPVPEANGHPWITSKIVARVSAKVVSTKSSDYVLEGMLNPCLRIGEQPDSMPPLFIMHKFKHGFPEDWKVLLDHWRKVDADRKLNEENSSLLWSSAIAGNASFLSKSGAKNYGSESNLSSMSSSSSISHLRRNNFKPVANSSLLPTAREAAVDSMSSMHHESTFHSEIATARPAERRARSRGVRVNKNSTASADGSDRRLEQGNSVAYAGDGSIEMSAGTNPQLQRTLSKQDFSLLRAKNYDNFSIVNSKKVYKCAFCNFVSPLFNNLKLHVKKNHVEGKNTTQALQPSPKKTNSIGKGRKTSEDESQSLSLSASDHRKKSNSVSPSKKETVHSTTMPARGRPRLRKEAEHTHSEAPERNLELTISQQNLVAMRAKKYESFTVVDKRKIYNCNFCDFTVKLFNDLKYHVRKNHLHSDGRRKPKAKQLYVSYSNPRARSDESQLNSETLHCSESRRRNSASPLKSISNQVIFSTTTTGEHIHNRKATAAQTSHHTTNSQQHRTLEQTISKQVEKQNITNSSFRHLRTVLRRVVIRALQYVPIC